MLDVSVRLIGSPQVWQQGITEGARSGAATAAADAAYTSGAGLLDTDQERAGWQISDYTILPKLADAGILEVD
jgi:hypothetical protein